MDAIVYFLMKFAPCGCLDCFDKVSLLFFMVFQYECIYLFLILGHEIWSQNKMIKYKIKDFIVARSCVVM